MNSTATAPGSLVFEEAFELIEEPEAVRQPGQLVVGRRPLEPLGASALLGDVFDVGDRQPAALALVQRRDPRSGPQHALIAADVAAAPADTSRRRSRRCVSSRHPASRRDG